jgi:hypothetical protein
MMIDIAKIFGIKAGVGIMLVLLLLYFIFFPFAVAWALNYLFNLTIAMTFDTWVAVTILHGFFHGVVKAK